jgi:uncharacterized protein
MTEPPHDPFSALSTPLGYVIAILSIAILIFAVLPSIRPPP